LLVGWTITRKSYGESRLHGIRKVKEEAFADEDHITVRKISEKVGKPQYDESLGRGNVRLRGYERSNCKRERERGREREMYSASGLSRYRYSLECYGPSALFLRDSPHFILSQNRPISHIRNPGFLPHFPIVHSQVPVAPVILARESNSYRQSNASLFGVGNQA